MRLILYWAFLLAFGLGLVSGFIIIFFSRFPFKFFFFGEGGGFHGFINQNSERTEKGTRYWFFGQTEIQPMVELVTS